ncbi:MAG: DUF1573 domain-containing protein [Pirellulales bacterium]|nr:DUF1573 domain-containing protein [Pirellulales bacterium]
MSRKIGLAGIVILLACSNCFGQEWARKLFKTTEHDFGAVAQGAKAEYKFVFENIYLEDLHVANVYTSCSCTGVRVENPSLKTYERGAIVAQFNTDSFLGRRGATITVVIDRPFPAEVQLHVRGFIRGDVSVTPGSVELGSIDQGREVNWDLSVKHVGDDSWRIVGVKSSNPHISAQVVEKGRYHGQVAYEVKVHLDEDAPAGYLNDRLLLLTNDQQGKEIPVLVEGRILPGVTVSPSLLFIGVVQPGQTTTKQLVVTGKTPFRVLNVSCGDESFQFDTSSAAEPKKLHLIPVTFRAGQRPGKVADTIRIETDRSETKHEVSAYAVVAGEM